MPREDFHELRVGGRIEARLFVEVPAHAADDLLADPVDFQQVVGRLPEYGKRSVAEPVDDGLASHWAKPIDVVREVGCQAVRGLIEDDFVLLKCKGVRVSAFRRLPFAVEAVPLADDWLEHLALDREACRGRRNHEVVAGWAEPRRLVKENPAQLGFHGFHLSHPPARPYIQDEPEKKERRRAPECGPGVRGGVPVVPFGTEQAHDDPGERERRRDAELHG